MQTRDAPAIALAFLAHPDDAEILCGGTLIRLAELGWQIHIATATAGDCGTVTLSADEIAAIRRGEAEKAANSIGAAYSCLGLRDVDVVFDHASNRLAIDLFRQISPSLVITHPRVDYMLDHEQVHLLARSAAFAFPIPNASDIPRLPRAGDVPGVPHLYYVDPLEGNDPYTGKAVAPTTTLDITGVIDRKAKMLACHTSQREWLREHHGMDEYIESMKRHSAARGELIGVGYAESFVQHRGHAFPTDDLLSDCLGTKTETSS